MSKPKTAATTHSTVVEEIAATTAPAVVVTLPDNLPNAVRVRAVYAPAYHLLTGEFIPQDGDKKIALDAFTRAQLEMGKWVLVD